MPVEAGLDLGHDEGPWMRGLIFGLLSVDIHSVGYYGGDDL